MAEPLPPKWVMSFMDGPLNFEWAYTSFFQVRSVQRRGNKYQLLASYKLHRNILDDTHNPNLQSKFTFYTKTVVLLLLYRYIGINFKSGKKD